MFECAPTYDRFMVKLPDPLHPDITPASVQVPDTVLLVSVPFKVKVSPGGTD